MHLQFQKNQDIENKTNHRCSLKKELQKDNSNLKNKEKEIIENAKIEARNILLEAKDEATNIIKMH